MSKQDKQEFTKKEVEELISRIIYQNSRKDIFYEANIVSKEYNMFFTEKSDEPSDDDIEDDFKEDDSDIDLDDIISHDDDDYGLGRD